MDVAGLAHRQFGRYGKPPATNSRSDAATRPLLAPDLPPLFPLTGIDPLARDRA